MSKTLDTPSLVKGERVDSYLVKDHLNKAFNIDIGMSECETLFAHLQYVLEQNRKVNLTSIKNEETGLLLHIEDSLTALDLLQREGPGSLVDVGSGAGYPGIPLAVVTKRETTLVEATTKKATILANFIKTAGLDSCITVMSMRVEEFTQQKSERYKIVTARALSILTSVMELAAPLLEIGGLLIAYKGAPSEKELEQAKNIEHLLGMKLEDRRKILLSNGTVQRELICIRKQSEAIIELPRRNGIAQKRPLE